MKIFLQEPTVPGRRGIYRAEVIADDGIGDYGLGYYYGWGYTPGSATDCALNWGFATVPELIEDTRLRSASNDFYDGLAPNRAVTINSWAVR